MAQLPLQFTNHFGEKFPRPFIRQETALEGTCTWHDSNHGEKTKLGKIMGTYLEDHPRYRKWLGSPLFISHEKAIYKGNNPS